MDTTKPHPQRFQVYNLLPDGKGFTIKDCKFIFKLDRYGGWRDEYGHYYNSHGEPDFEPQDAQLTPSQGSFHSDDIGDDYGQFQPDYDDVEDDDQHQQHHSNWEIRNMQKISKNIQILSTYPNDKPLRVYFSNMQYKAPPKSVYQAYAKKVDGILNIIFDLEDNRRNGQGHFIMENVKKAQTLIKLQGQKVIQRQVHFDVEKVSQLMVDPISQADMKPFWGTSTTKVQPKKQQKKVDDIPRFKAAPAQTKKEQPKKQEKKQLVQSKEEKKVQQPKQEPVKKQLEVKKQPEEKPETKKQSEQQFKRYQLNFEIFETKTKFFNWLKQNGAQKDVDVKNIDKKQNGTEIKITMEVKTKLVEKLNGKLYNGKQIKFTLV